MECPQSLSTIDELRNYVAETLASFESLDAPQWQLHQRTLYRSGKPCGIHCDLGVRGEQYSVLPLVRDPGWTGSAVDVAGDVSAISHRSGKWRRCQLPFLASPRVLQFRKHIAEFVEAGRRHLRAAVPKHLQVFQMMQML
jgi:hypothetical protein